MLVGVVVVLNIGKLAAGKAAYYLRLASGVEDYYTGHGEPPGSWFGAGADRLGLAGTVAPGDLTAVLEGRHPATGVGLTRARMAGFDLTFRAPKTVSLLYALGDPATVTAEVVAAHETAVAAAVQGPGPNPGPKPGPDPGPRLGLKAPVRSGQGWAAGWTRPAIEPPPDPAGAMLAR